MLYFPKLLLNLEFYVEMYLEFKNTKKSNLLWFQPVIKNKKAKPEVGKWGGNSSSLFYPLPPFPPVSILSVIILSIRSEEVLLFLVLLIHINTHNRMEINL